MQECKSRKIPAKNSNNFWYVPAYIYKKLVQKIKDVVRKLKPLELPPHNTYLIIESYGRIGGWKAVLKFRPTKKYPWKKKK